MQSAVSFSLQFLIGEAVEGFKADLGTVRIVVRSLMQSSFFIVDVSRLTLIRKIGKIEGREAVNVPFRMAMHADAISSRSPARTCDPNSGA